MKFTPSLKERDVVCFVLQDHNTHARKYSHRFSMKFKTELRRIPLIIFEMFLQLPWSPSVVNSVEWAWFGKACLYKVPPLTARIRAQTRREVEGIVCRYARQVCLEAKLGEGHRNISAALKVAMSTAASLRLRTALPRAGQLSQLSDRTGRWIPKCRDGSVQKSRGVYSTHSYPELRETQMETIYSLKIGQSGKEWSYM